MKTSKRIKIIVQTGTVEAFETEVNGILEDFDAKGYVVININIWSKNDRLQGHIIYAK